MENTKMTIHGVDGNEYQKWVKLYLDRDYSKHYLAHAGNRKVFGDLVHVLRKKHHFEGPATDREVNAFIGNITDSWGLGYLSDKQLKNTLAQLTTCKHTREGVYLDDLNRDALITAISEEIEMLHDFYTDSESSSEYGDVDDVNW